MVQYGCCSVFHEPVPWFASFSGETSGELEELRDKLEGARSGKARLTLGALE